MPSYFTKNIVLKNLRYFDWGEGGGGRPIFVLGWFIQINSSYVFIYVSWIKLLHDWS